MNAQKIIPKAWIVFSHETDLPWLRILKSGFRHCFVILNDGHAWVSFDPLSGHSEISVHHVPPDFDLPGWLEGRGHKVVPASINHAHKRPAPPMLFTCVEAVKRVLGLHSIFILTPWQLYKRLERDNSKDIFNQKEIYHGKYSIPA